MKTIAEIRALREPLVAESARQRDAIGLRYSSLQGPANAVALGLGALSWLRRHPLVVGVAAAVLVVARPRRALRLATRGLILWRLLRAIRDFLRQTGVAS
ncbi:MAG: hypothetical protein A3H35_21790 [Betaproteobacteria bacterium RIFCSPLOWO2_02_FULL_62_17]|nr:MAG: hypothetical protein A3H35_21790 [Betaproteobacteria bacterium RIFCSPLOWO2_02_FULL_62_17]